MKDPQMAHAFFHALDQWMPKFTRYLGSEEIALGAKLETKLEKNIINTAEKDAYCLTESLQKNNMKKNERIHEKHQ